MNKKGLRMIVFLGFIMICLFFVNRSNSITNNRARNNKNEQNSENIRYRRAQKKVREAARLEKEESMSDKEESKSDKEESISKKEKSMSEKKEAVLESKEAMSENRAGQKAIELIRMTGSAQDIRKQLNQYPAQTEIEVAGASSTTRDQLFYSQVISEDIKSRMNGKSYSKDCTVPYSELRYIRLLYWGVDHKTHIGELIVNQSITEDVIEIFKELYAVRYPIENMVLVDEYDADDIASMEADNSSAFNFRFIDSTTKISVHSYGLAIDINPRYNPYVRQMGGKTVILPENGSEYADRRKDCKYYIKQGDICYEAFIKRGFTWGGDWKNEKDYQHFQKNLND